MKNLLTLISLFYILALSAQKITPIDEISLGFNYTLPSGKFDDGYISTVKQERFMSKSGFSVGLFNIARKTNILQFVYGIEFNYLSSGFIIDYEPLDFDSTKWQGINRVEDDLKGSLNSMIISVPLICRLDFTKTNLKIPVFIDAGVKYDFITVSQSKYDMDYYQIHSYYYLKEKLVGKTRFYNKRANLVLNLGVGASINHFTMKLTYNYTVSTVKNTVLDYYGKGDIKNNYLNFSVNYKLRK